MLIIFFAVLVRRLIMNHGLIITSTCTVTGRRVEFPTANISGRHRMRIRMHGLHMPVLYAAGLPLVCRWSAAGLPLVCRWSAAGPLLVCGLSADGLLWSGLDCPPAADCLPACRTRCLSAWYVVWCDWLHMPVCLLECDLPRQYVHVNLYCSSITGGWLVTRCVCVVFRCTDGT